MADEFDVQLKDVSKRFRESVAVDNISLDVRHGEFFSLLGPSGCGKTTTLRMIAGFEHPTSGEVWIRDKVVNDIPPFRRETNLVFQQLALFPHLDVFDNIAFGLRIKKAPKADIQGRVLHILDVVQLQGFEHRTVRQLSGGQQQRVAIARALVNEPAVLLLDEPLGALDLQLRLQMQIELKELQHRLGTTFIYVTHDQGEALTMSDRIAVMNQGRIEQIGPCRDVYLKPRTTFVASFIGETNLLAGRVRSVESGRVVLEAEGLRIGVETNEPVGEDEQVNLSIRPEMIEIRHPGDTYSNDGENVFPMRVSSVTFHGTTVRYQVVLPSGATWHIQRLAGDAAVFDAGADVLVSFRSDNAVVLRTSTAPDGER